MRTFEQHIYTATATGRIWQGNECKFQRQFDHMPTKEEVKTFAGDFESLGRITVQHTHRVVTEQVTVSRL